MVEGIAQRALDDARRLSRHEPALVLPLELGLADEDRDEAGARDHHVVGRQHRRAFALADAVGVILQPAQEGAAKPRLVRAAVRRRDRVAIGMDEAVGVGEPRHRPFDRAMPGRLLHLAGEHLLGHLIVLADLLQQIIAQPAWKAEHGLGRNVCAGDERGRAMPADLDATEEIGFCARHAETGAPA